MRSIDKKLWRELWHMRMQAVAIALVIVGGVSIFSMSLNTLDSLFETRATYYRNHHFADVFASLKRAPLSLVKRIEEIPGVDKVETRVLAYVNLDVEGFNAVTTGVARGKCHQIANGCIYKDEDITEEKPKNKEFTIIHEKKLDALEDLIEELDGKTLLIGYKIKHLSDIAQQ